MSPWWRVFVKLGAFGFAFSFVLFFVVYGFRYAGPLGFVSKNVYFEGQFWGDSGEVEVDGNTLYSQGGTMQLFNLDSKCYRITFRGDERTHCFRPNSVNFDIFVSKGDVKQIAETPFMCSSVERLAHSKNSIQGIQWGNPITSAFSARKMNFIQTQNSLYACSSTFSSCRNIGNFEGIPVCSTKDGIVANLNGQLYMHEIY